MLHQHNRMVESSRNIDHFLVMESSHLFRQLLILCIAMAKLAMIASAECVYLSVFTQGYGMIAATSYLGYVNSFGNVSNCIHKQGLFLLGDWLVLVT